MTITSLEEMKIHLCESKSRIGKPIREKLEDLAILTQLSIFIADENLKTLELANNKYLKATRDIYELFLKEINKILDSDKERGE